MKALRIYLLLAVTVLAVAGCGVRPASPLLPGLTIEEHALKDRPEVDPLAFVPVKGTQEGILHKHQAQRERVSTGISPASGATARLGDEEVTAKGNWRRTDQGGEVSVEVLCSGQVIYSAPLGVPSPFANLRGLMAYDNHWVLEVAHVTWKTGSPGSDLAVAGDIVVDGDSLSTSKGYQEAFGFQLIKGKPFYFFVKQEQVGLSYDGQEALLGYTLVPHYQCCSASDLNPRSGQDMVAFFAQGDPGTPRGGWFYVEIGAFE